MTTGSPGPDDGRVGDEEHHRLRRHLGAHLPGVVGVVAADADDLAPGNDRREQPHVVHEVRRPRQLDLLVERVARDLGDLLAGAVDQPEDRVLTCRKPRDAHVPSLTSAPGVLPTAVASARHTLDDRVRTRDDQEPVGGRRGRPRMPASTPPRPRTCAVARTAGGTRSRTSCSPTTPTGPPGCAAGTPGAGVVLRGRAGLPQADWRFYRADATASCSTWSRSSSRAARHARLRRDAARPLDARPPGPVRLLRAARVGHGLPPRPRTMSGTRAGRCGSARPAPTRSSRAHQIAVLALRRVPLLHASGAAPLNALQPTRESQPTSSSRAACTPGWTSTSGRTSSCPPCRASSSWTASTSPATSARSTCAPRPTTCSELGYEPVRDRDSRRARRSMPPRSAASRRAARAAPAPAGRRRPARPGHARAAGDRRDGRAASDQRGRQRTGTPALTRP